MAYNYIEDLVLENSRIVRRNLSGRPTKFTREGDRSLSVVINPENVDMLREIGWNVKELPPKKDVEGSESLFVIDVRVNMDSSRPPKIYIVTSKNKILLDKDSVGTIDSADIRNVDMVIHPHKWEMPSGKTGVKAYLNTMYVTIAEDVFAEKYSELTEDFVEDDMPQY